MLVRLTMICNGATAATRQGAFPADEPLEPRSLTLATAMRGTLRRADRVWSAPALRARQIAEALGLEASVEPLLADQDYGRWAGKSFDDVRGQQPEGIVAWLTDPDAAPHGGESLADVASRASKLMNGLIAERGHTVAVTHASVIRTAILHVLGAPLAASSKIDIEPLSITDFRSDGRRWVLRACGVTGPKPANPRGA
ncbi:histidine phosphatase family protein [Mesorhizobium sp. M00.F.Ca.ET.186.01.1.1]|nr:histidine phosphatase family protein [bacterium M00.F.Ca.ET.205.01.1.1]TGU48214.1 histidine phosphatase family protein [bacterium M00.F.Ca.ET.152.01.1.1]TGV32453.1 histidine phosphatase family protein [Mesorhizobium sp. M00.F.Ca.ET.186.01.1.1]TGZ39666.1 histidine phosphatase family protein [bacterium M00.F.Ca.ET.162.01.1.1]TIW62934.1 MAG: histidine phosphatase family protein [Mesorhizobium sp.]